MSFEGEKNQNKEPTFTQRVQSLLIDVKPKDKHNGIAEVHQDALFRAFMKKLSDAEMSARVAGDTVTKEAILNNTQKEIISDLQTMPFEDLEVKYRFGPEFEVSSLKEQEKEVSAESETR